MDKATKEEVRELAEAYVVGYTMNNPHDAEQERLSELGIDYGMLRDILETHHLLRESEVDSMTEDEFDAATEAATAEIVEAAADALDELMEG